MLLGCDGQIHCRDRSYGTLAPRAGDNRVMDDPDAISPRATWSLNLWLRCLGHRRKVSSSFTQEVRASRFCATIDSVEVATDSRMVRPATTRRPHQPRAGSKFNRAVWSRESEMWVPSHVDQVEAFGRSQRIGNKGYGSM